MKSPFYKRLDQSVSGPTIEYFRIESFYDQYFFAKAIFLLFHDIEFLRNPIWKRKSIIFQNHHPA